MNATRVAAIDIGTNSVLLLVAEARGGELVPVLERATITRLGQGVDASRALAPDAITRTLSCLERYAAEIREAGASRVAAVGTSAMRDARGGDDFRARAREILGEEPRVISGDEEAALTFAGALVGIQATGCDVVVFDLGGGSTEIIRRRGAAGALEAESLDIGSVRLTERHVRADPPTPGELDAIRADVGRALGGARVKLDGAGALVGVAGTVTTLAALAHDIVPYDGALVHGARLSAVDVARVRAELAGMPFERRRALPALDPGRADVIVAGCLIVEEILAASGASELIASDRGVRWGLALRLADAREDASTKPTAAP